MKKSICIACLAIFITTLCASTIFAQNTNAPITIHSRDTSINLSIKRREVTMSSADSAAVKKFVKDNYKVYTSIANAVCSFDTSLLISNYSYTETKPGGLTKFVSNSSRYTSRVNVSISRVLEGNVTILFTAHITAKPGQQSAVSVVSVVGDTEWYADRDNNGQWTFWWHAYPGELKALHQGLVYNASQWTNLTEQKIQKKKGFFQRVFGKN